MTRPRSPILRSPPTGQGHSGGDGRVHAGILTTMTDDARTWFTTGASSGIGLSLVQVAASRGDNVVALARHVESTHRLVDDHGACRAEGIRRAAARGIQPPRSRGACHGRRRRRRPTAASSVHGTLRREGDSRGVAGPARRAGIVGFDGRGRRRCPRAVSLRRAAGPTGLGAAPARLCEGARHRRRRPSDCEGVGDPRIVLVRGHRCPENHHPADRTAFRSRIAVAYTGIVTDSTDSIVRTRGSTHRRASCTGPLPPGHAMRALDIPRTSRTSGPLDRVRARGFPDSPEFNRMTPRKKSPNATR